MLNFTPPTALVILMNDINNIHRTALTGDGMSHAIAYHIYADSMIHHPANTFVVVASTWPMLNQMHVILTNTFTTNGELSRSTNDEIELTNGSIILFQTIPIASKFRAKSYHRRYYFYTDITVLTVRPRHKLLHYCNGNLLNSISVRDGLTCVQDDLLTYI